MISERLNFIKRNQKKLRAEDYIHLRDAVVNDGHLNASNIGQHVILPSSFTGSPRFMNEKSQDAMTYVRKFGRPDLFITFTCNPEWPEIKRSLISAKATILQNPLYHEAPSITFGKEIHFLEEDAGKMLRDIPV
ncbi:hypothetical protein EVAR_87053_1 [Eumeta japonica]|uniref:Helitron helicase-like domain-containing protein n=1 Tax=Eumeta variegata TaxID=151549 RepID=A0A4C1VQY1_EUMVA|nr:hypothetical protein EVAR_87053_1 [Eumeta japonica]